MRRLTIALAILLISSSTVLLGQQKTRGKIRLIRFPPDTARIFVALQPRCDLKFDEMELFMDAERGGPILRYVLRNTSHKSVRYLSVRFYHKSNLTAFGKYGFSTEMSVGTPDVNNPYPLGPNETYESISADEFEVIDGNKKTAEILSKVEPNNALPLVVYIGVVTKVVYEDGSVFDDSVNLSKLPEF
jgi:hypothetical protein